MFFEFFFVFIRWFCFFLFLEVFIKLYFLYIGEFIVVGEMEKGMGYGDRDVGSCRGFIYKDVNK